MFRRSSKTGAERNRTKSPAGFTLIETMFVVVIVAILVALAMPSYLEQVRKSRRADAASSLLDAAQLLERCFTRLNAYNADGCPNPAGASQDGFYQITMARDANSYTLTAIPQSGQASDPCGTFSIDYLGNKLPAANGDRCWGSSG